MIPTLDDQVRILSTASEDELMALLGGQALPIMVRPDSLLSAGREGKFVEGRAVAGKPSSDFYHQFLKNVGQSFLIRFCSELRSACCGNTKKYDEIRQDAGNKTGLAIAAIVGTLTAALPPSLAAFNGLILVLAMLIFQCGAAAFCAMLGDLQKK